MKTFIQDRERVLDSTNDLLKTSLYAESLVKVINNTPKDKVFTIGVFGGWGTGKSSIIRTAQEEIEKNDKDVKFITYDAWKYSNDSFRRMFLLKLQQELRMPQTDEMKRFYQSETAEAAPKTKLSVKGLVFAVAVVAILSIVLFLIPGVSIEWKVAMPTMGTMGTFLFALLNGCFYDLNISFSKPALFAPEQFEACFKQMMSKCLKQVNWVQKKWIELLEYVKVGETSIVGLDRLIIVIDNIDRCPSDMAYQLLTDVKTFLSNEEYSLVFIVPVDDEALKKHLFRRWSKSKDDEADIHKEKEEFLRKFFNVTIRIKRHRETELLHFAHEINKENKLDYSNDTLAIVSKEFADNPRRIIQLLNNLSGDLALYEDAFAKQYETAICAALILREEHPDFYKTAVKNLDVILKFKEYEAKGNNVNESLVAFMRVVDVVFKQTPLDALLRIFTNTASIFSDLPEEIHKAVRTYDTIKIIEYVKDNAEQKNDLISYTIESLNTEVKYAATTQTTQWIDFLSQLCKAQVFDDTRFNSINSALAMYYKPAIAVIKNQDALNYMAYRMKAVGITQLYRTIIESLKGENVEANPNFESVMKGYLTYNTKKEDCDEVAEVVAKHYVDNPIDQGFAYTDTQIMYLFGDNFMSKQIENLKAANDKARVENMAWCLKHNKELSGETHKALFAKYLQLFGNTRGKKKEAYIELIRQLQPILEAIETSTLHKEPEEIFKLITGKRGIPNPSFPMHTAHDGQRSILSEVNDEEAAIVTDFCYEIARISGGRVDVKEAIQKLYEKNSTIAIKGALRVEAVGISIAPFASIFIKADNYESHEVLSVTEKLLTRQDDGHIMVGDEALKAKVRQLVEKSSNTDVEHLLGRLVKDKQILVVVTTIVASLDSKTINKLPISIAKYAVSTFQRENAETYKDNVDFLIQVLKLGDASQIKEVVRLMKGKLNNEEDLENVVLVLDNLVSEDQQMLNILIGELQEIKDSDTVSEAIKESIAALVAKLSMSLK